MRLTWLSWRDVSSLVDSNGYGPNGAMSLTYSTPVSVHKRVAGSKERQESHEDVGNIEEMEWSDDSGEKKEERLDTDST